MAVGAGPVGPHFNLFHLRCDQRLITTKQYLFTIGQTFNPSSINNLELREFALSISNHASLSLWPSDAGLAPAAQLNQIQENEVMQVASLCFTLEPAVAGSGHLSPDDIFELQLFELELNIRLQAHFLANKSQGFVLEQWVMSKEDLAARFKSAYAKLLVLQRQGDVG